MSIGQISAAHEYSSSAVSHEGHTDRNFLSAVVERLPGAARRISAIAIPVIVIAAASAIPRANGGPVAFGLCVSACEAGLSSAGLTLAAPTGGVGAICAAVSAYWACPIICAPFLAAPSP